MAVIADIANFDPHQFSFVNATLNAEGVFGRAEITGLASQVVSLVLLWAFHGMTGIWVLVYSQTIGKLIELASASWFLGRKGVRYRPCWRAEGHDLAKFFKVIFIRCYFFLRNFLPHESRPHLNSNDALAPPAPSTYHPVILVILSKQDLPAILW